jgi:hypothetical protein
VKKLYRASSGDGKGKKPAKLVRSGRIQKPQGEKKIVKLQFTNKAVLEQLELDSILPPGSTLKMAMREEMKHTVAQPTVPSHPQEAGCSFDNLTAEEIEAAEILARMKITEEEKMAAQVLVDLSRSGR